MRVDFHGLQFDLPPGWTDITDDLPNGTPPTLARPGGLGVIQFSTVRYSGGERPLVTKGVLRDISEQFCSQKLPNFRFDESYVGTLPSVKATSVSEEGFFAVWHITNGMDVVLATYTVQEWADEIRDEVEEADRLMKSMSF